MLKSNDKYYNCHIAMVIVMIMSSNKLNAVLMKALRPIFDCIYLAASDTSTYNIDNTLIATPYPYQVKLQYDQY